LTGFQVLAELIRQSIILLSNVYNDNLYYIKRRYTDTVADPGGANPAMAPHRSWQWSLAPLGGRKNNVCSV